MENFEKTRTLAPNWIRPDFRNERGEIERATRDFLGQEPSEESINSLYALLEAAPLVELSDEEWKALENTDSFHNVGNGDIEKAASLTEEYNQDLDAGHKRDFPGLLEKMKTGADMEVPVIIKKDGRLHLVSGNTRLMISRALSYRPKVILAEIR